MKTRTAWKIVVLAAALGVATAGCSLFGGGSGGPGQASLYLTDAATNSVEEVNVTITGVQVHRNGVWEEINSFDPGYTVNLLDLRFDTKLLGSAQLPAGAYSQIRLIVDDSSTGLSNVVDQQGTWPLKAPSGSETGLKIHHNFVVPSKGSVSLVLDANVLDFVHKTGSGFYIINPTAVRVATLSATGTIKGRVVAASDTQAITGTDVVVTLRMDRDHDGRPEDVDGDGVYDPSVDMVAQTTALKQPMTDASGDVHQAGEFQLNAVTAVSEPDYMIEVSADGYATWNQTSIGVAAGGVTEVDGDPSTTVVDPISLTATP